MIARSLVDGYHYFKGTCSVLLGFLLRTHYRHIHGSEGYFLKYYILLFLLRERGSILKQKK